MSQRLFPPFASGRRAVITMLALIGAWSAQARAKEPLEVSYDIEAELPADGRRLEGRLRITVRAEAPLHELELLMFPAHLNDTRLLNDIVFPRVYPGAVSRAALTFTPVWNGVPLEVVPAPTPPGWAAGTLVAVRLPKPSEPGEPVTVEGGFRLDIPHRYGLFGQAAGQVTLEGGWFPTVVAHDGSSWAPIALPPRAHLTLTLTHASGRTVVLDDLPPSDVTASTGAAEATPMVTSQLETTSRLPALVVGRQRAYPLDLEGVPLTLYDARDRPLERRQLERLLSHALDIWKRSGLPAPISPPPLVRAPLRRTLAVVMEHEVLLSDRALRVFPLVRRFHDFPVLHAVYQSWLAELLADRLPTEERLWVSDGLAWWLVGAYRESIVAGGLQATDIIKPLSFIPSFDEMLYAPKFPFAGEMYESPYTSDPLREEVLRFLLPRASGRVMFMKLEDRYGAEAVRSAGMALLKGEPGTFLSLLADRVHRPVSELEAWSDSWQRPYPDVNYRLEHVTRVRSAEGYQTSFTLREQQVDRAPPEEPVTVQIDTAHERRRLSWKGSGSIRETVVTADRVQEIAIDPDRRLLEIDPDGVILRDDNYWPRRRKVLVSIVPGSFDLSVYKPQGVVALYITRPNNRDWVSLLETYSDSQVLVGSSLGTFRYFGRHRDSQWKVNRVGLQAVVGHRAGRAFFGSSADGAYLDTFGFRISYRYESRLTLLDSRSGGYFYAAFEEGYARSHVDEHLYSVFSLAGIKNIPVHPRHILSVRGQVDAGFGLGEELVTVGLFTLGGASGVRAMGVGEPFGNRRWLASIEYRGLLLEGLDIDLWAVRGRGVQVALFADAGGVGQALEDLLRPRYDYGVGVRLFGDLLGLRPSMVGLDLAWQPGGGSRPRPILRFSQAF